MNNRNDPNEKRRNAFAERYYNQLRNSNEDLIVAKMALNSGLDEKTVKTAFVHALKSEYDLFDPETYGVTKRRFDPSYDMAYSFQRLYNGSAEKHDVIMLQHEAFEANLMDNKGMSYVEAHELTNEVYNYQQALKEWGDSK